MNIVAIIQARMGSTRLPGKVLQDLSGQSVLCRVVRRVQRASTPKRVLVATTSSRNDDAVVVDCARLGVQVFRGDERDVLDRYWRAAQFVGADTVVRITADCPLIDPSLIDDVVRGFLQSSADYASNVLERTYPRGLDVEVISAKALEKAWRNADQSHQREHVTPYFYENPGLFKLLSVRGKTDCTAYRWTLDTDEDLHLIRTIYERFDGKDDFSWTDVLRLMEQEPKLLSINSAIIQKAVRDA